MRKRIANKSQSKSGWRTWVVRGHPGTIYKSRIQDPESWFRIQVRGSRVRIQDAVLDPGSRVLDPGSGVQDPGSWIFEGALEASVSGPRALSAGLQPLGASLRTSSPQASKPRPRTSRPRPQTSKPSSKPRRNLKAFQDDLENWPQKAFSRQFLRNLFQERFCRLGV